MAETKKPAATIEAAFVAAWLAIKNPELDGRNPHFGNKYATLKATLKVVREACETQGIAYRQILVPTDDGAYLLRSSVMDDKGNVFECSTLPVETPPNPQSFGSNMTYAKRQQAQLDWGITGEVDDDGEAGAEAAKSATRQSTPTRTRSSNQRAASTRQDAPDAKSNNGKTEQEKRADYITRIAELRAEAEALGVKPEGIDLFIEATYHGVPIEALNLVELTTLGKHLAGLIEDKKQLAAEKEQADG